MATNLEVRFPTAASLPQNSSFQSHQSKKNNGTHAISIKTTGLLEKQPLSKDQLIELPSIRKNVSISTKAVDKEGTINKMHGVGQKQLQKPDSRVSNHAERAKEFDKQSLSNGKKRKREEDSEPEAKNSAKRARTGDQPHKLRVENSAPKSRLPPKLKAQQEKPRQQVVKIAGVVALLPREGAPKINQNAESLKPRINLPPKKRDLNQVSQASKESAKTVHVVKSKWTAKDDELLLKGYEIHGAKWAFINRQYLEDKFDREKCYKRYMRVIHPNRKMGPWTEEEKQKLLEGIEKYGETSWAKIAREIFKWTRSDKDCLQEYTRSLDPNIQYGKWTEKEDKKLIKRHKEGLSFTECGREIGRGGWQCYNRYHYYLEKDFIKGTWTTEEIKKLQEGREKYGNRLTRISKEIFHGTRSPEQCRNKLRDLQKNQ